MFTINSFAQTEVHWTLDPLNVPGNTEAQIGTSSDDPLFFVTNNIKRMTIDVDGKLAVSTLTGSGYRLLYVDENGNLGTMANRPVGGGNTNSAPCNTGASAWFEGGNNTGSVGSSEIGTCNNNDFILKAYNKRSLFITAQDAFVGLGLNNTSPSALLDINDPGNSSNAQHLKIYGDQFGTIESTADMNLHYTGGFHINNNVHIDASDRILFGSGTISGNNKVTINSGTSDALQVRITGNSSSQVNAFSVFDSYTNKINFSVKSDGSAFARYIKVTVNNIPDYVFKKDYKLPSLKEVETFYLLNSHLPEIPCAKEIEKEGMDLGEMNKLLLKKIEELTLYMVAQNKKVESLQKQLDELKK